MVADEGGQPDQREGRSPAHKSGKHGQPEMLPNENYAWQSAYPESAFFA